MAVISNRISLLLLAGSLAAWANAASAQSIAGTSNGVVTGPVVGTSKGPAPKAPQPPALPGARTTENEAAPAGKGVADLQPTDALFDAINRGDIAAARDAINRGAELNARNVLGMSPTELAVDLGRNDITFLLLSLRGSDGASPPPSQTAQAPATNGKRPAKVAAAAPAPRAPRVSQVSAPNPDAARQYATGPGTPIPQAGFLGFGGVTR